jgi:cell division protein ZapA (FtsZ GTPase activity inhibitor)
LTKISLSFTLNSMNNVREDRILDEATFEVLGQKLKLKRDEKLDGIGPSDIVGFVQSEALKIINQSPQLSQSQVAVLLALKFAGEKLALEKEYRENIRLLRTTAADALQYIEEVSPTTR